MIGVGLLEPKEGFEGLPIDAVRCAIRQNLSGYELKSHAFLRAWSPTR